MKVRFDSGLPIVESESWIVLLPNRLVLIQLSPVASGEETDAEAAHATVLLSSTSMVCVEVELDGGKLVVREVGAGARDWFRDAPFRPDQGMLLRDFLYVGDWPAIDELGHLLQHYQSHAEVTVRLGCFEPAEYPQRCVDRRRLINQVHVKYVPVKVEVAFLKTACRWPMDRDRSPPPPAPRAVVTFLLPDGWYWEGEESHVEVASDKTEPRAPARARGKWKHRDDDRTNKTGANPFAQARNEATEASVMPAMVSASGQAACLLAPQASGRLQGKAAQPATATSSSTDNELDLAAYTDDFCFSRTGSGCSVLFSHTGSLGSDCPLLFSRTGSHCPLLAGELLSC